MISVDFLYGNSYFLFMPKLFEKGSLPAISLLLYLSVMQPLWSTEQPKRELQAIRQEISKYEKELQQTRSRETAALSLLATLDRDIDLTTRYIRNLTREINDLNRQIDQYDADIRRLIAEIKNLREFIKRRMVRFYKFERSQRYALLMGQVSWTRLKTWARFQKMIVDSDRRTFESLVEKKTDVERKKELLRLEITERERKIRVRSQEDAQLKGAKSKRQKVLSTIRSDRQAIEQHLSQVREAEKQITSLIANAERARLSGQSQSRQTITRGKTAIEPFVSQRGRLIWPARGQIISRFGRQQHPKLKTVTENLGIEIQAAEGETVQSVSDGRIQAITWQRGRGNIVIISHDEGYYTVYTNLQEILVSVDQEVSGGQKIGTVGESGSLHGPVLNFQIWKNTQNLNPEDWLS
ncbi:peptidoglycan DD-metalloendopeptidase family protein [candidate division KSB1 bacterium]|nr:peptidoglycan DD-metalloendopeptidase family protein [candidate division KSB1 bacterium]